jgi:hypothetical protein
MAATADAEATDAAGAAAQDEDVAAEVDAAAAASAATVEAEELAEKRRPLGLVDSMPLLLKCSGGRCRQKAQLRRIFFTTPAVYSAAAASSAGGEAESKCDVACARTLGGEAVDHAAVASWRCKLRLKVAGSLADASVIVDGNTAVPALDFLRERRQQQQRGAVPTANTAAASTVLDRTDSFGRQLSVTAAAAASSTAIDLMEQVELLLPAATYFVLRLPSVPLLGGQPLLVGPLAKELRSTDPTAAADTSTSTGAETKTRRRRDDGGRGGGGGGGSGGDGGPGLRLMLGEFLRPVGGKEQDETEEGTDQEQPNAAAY